MNTRVITLVTTVLLLCGSRAVAAQSFTVSSATLGTMNITSAVAGLDPTPVIQASTTYTLRTKKNTGETRVTAQLSAPLPAGVTLTVTLPGPGGGVVGNTVTLTTAPQDVLTNLPAENITFPATTITYELRAPASAGIVGITARTITFTLQ